MPAFPGTVPAMVGAHSASLPAPADPRKEYLLGGPTPQFSGAGGLLRAFVYDDVVARYGSRVYDMMHHDDACSSAMFLLKAGALAEGVRLLPAVNAPEGVEVTDPDLKRRIEISTEIYEFCQRVMAALGDTINATLWELMDGLAFGCNLAEHKFALMTDGPDKGRLFPIRFACKPRWAWSFVMSPVMELQAIRAYTMNGWQDIEPDHFTVFSWQPINGDPRGQSLYRPVYPWFDLKLQVFPDYGQFLKKFASASLVIEAGEGQQPQTIELPDGTVRTLSPQEQNLAAGLEFENHTVLALAFGAKGHVLFSQGTGEAFDRAFDRCDRTMFRKIILATRALQEAKHGSKADTETNLDAVFGMAVAQVRNPLGAAFRRQFLMECIRPNWGDQAAREFTPLVEFGASEHLQSALLGALADAWEKGFIDPGQLPWAWSSVGAPIPHGWQPDDYQQPGQGTAPEPAQDATGNPGGGQGSQNPGEGDKTPQGDGKGQDGNDNQDTGKTSGRTAA